MASIQAQRKKARTLAMQAVYRWLVDGEQSHIVLADILADSDPKRVDPVYCQELLEGVLTHRAALHENYQQYVSDKNEYMPLVDEAILLLASYELHYCLETPYKVIINEAINLAKKFAAPESASFINAVLHKVAIQQRSVEVTAAQQAGDNGISAD